MDDETEDREAIGEGAESVSASAVGPRAARRRLMLGAAAVLPSVFTLASGAQTAVASTAACLSRGQTGGLDPIEGGPRTGGLDPVVAGDLGSPNASNVPRLTMDKDQWLRKQVYYGRSYGYPAYCAMDKQSACIDPTNRARPAMGSVWMVNGQRVTVSQQDVIRQISSGPDAYALVYVNQEGSIATVDPTVADVRPVTGNCWDSMLGGRAQRSNLG
jgi:hypothetical protein